MIDRIGQIARAMEHLRGRCRQSRRAAAEINLTWAASRRDRRERRLSALKLKGLDSTLGRA